MLKKGEAGQLEFRLVTEAGVPTSGHSWASGEVKLRLPGAGSFSNVDPADITDIGNGIYAIELDATDTATEGKAYYYIDSAALPGYLDEARSESIIDFSSLTLPDIADAVWDEVMENSKSAREFMVGIKAVLWGKSARTGTSRNYRDDADTKDRIVSTVNDATRVITSEDLA